MKFPAIFPRINTAPMQRSKIPYVFLGLAFLLAISAVALLIIKPGVKPISQSPQNPPTTEPAKPDIPGKIDKAVPYTPPKTIPENPGVANSTNSPEELVNRIAKALESGDLAALERLIGKDALDPDTVARLKTLNAAGLRLREVNGIREVGELELNSRTRWLLELADKDSNHNKILLDLTRKNGKWSVEKITLPPSPGTDAPKTTLPDPLDIADAFVQAVLKQNFEFARAFVDSATVSDAKIAGLCILFEEGEYKLRKSKPLRAMFQRQDTVGFLANVETSDAKQSAQFSLTLRQPPAPAKWIVSEINLDQLLADYARRVAGGDVYYSPLVKNPAGGDTLALYFEFDQDEMNPRTRRQLEIVSMILKADPGKKLTLSGHTDALGSNDYNNGLSSRRADVVRDFLIAAGVAKSQIVTLGKGSSQPRRPNVTETGEDNPAGRRANRRTEIYLDF
jgi:outer membrane protein OmpA-like peptidoglycan-associated protein